MAAEKLCFKKYLVCYDDKFLSKTRKRVNRKSYKKRKYGTEHPASFTNGDSGGLSEGLNEAFQSPYAFSADVSTVVLGATQSPAARRYEEDEERVRFKDEDKDVERINKVRERLRKKKKTIADAGKHSNLYKTRLLVIDLLLGEEPLTRKEIIDIIQREIGLKYSIANAYYERIMQELLQEEQSSPLGILKEPYYKDARKDILVGLRQKKSINKIIDSIAQKYNLDKKTADKVYTYVILQLQKQIRKTVEQKEFSPEQKLFEIAKKRVLKRILRGLREKADVEYNDLLKSIKKGLGITIKEAQLIYNTVIDDFNRIFLAEEDEEETKKIRQIGTDISADNEENIDSIDDKNTERDETEAEFKREEHKDRNRQGVIRTVKGAHLVFKRQSPDGTYEELWIYPVRDGLKRGLEIKKAILAGTDIPPDKMKSPDGSQTYTITTLGDAQLLHITGLPN